MILDAVGFEQAIEGADLVITGEGKLDYQTLSGKLPYKVAQRAAARRVPVIAICGAAEIDQLPGAPFPVFTNTAVTPLSSSNSGAASDTLQRSASLKSLPLPSALKRQL